jgi:hypothetical protein
VADQEVAAGPQVHPSLALPDLLSQLHPDRRLRILDLGPAIGSNLTFWNQRYLCTMEVADLYPSLVTAPEGDAVAAVAAALPAGDDRPLDVVLAWDLFNYLDRPRLLALGERLAARCRPQAILFAMLSTAKEIPVLPGRYPIEDGSRLLYDVDATRQRPGPRYRPADIAAMTPGFSTDRNFLLRHGIQEYLLIRDAEAAAGG